MAGLSVFWAESLDADGDGDLDILYTLAGFRVPEEQRQAGYITEDGEGYTVAYLLLNEGGSMKRFGDAMGEESRQQAFLHGHVRDLNSDGFPDLVVDDWQVDIGDSIFLNDGRGRFHQYSANFGTGAYEKNNVVPIDYNNDGVMDFINHVLFNSYWDNGAEINLWRGTQLLPSCAGSP